MGAAETAIYGGRSGNATAAIVPAAIAPSAALDEVLGIAVKIFEHHGRVVCLVPECFAEDHAPFLHDAMVAGVRFQEEEYSAPGRGVIGP